MPTLPGNSLCQGYRKKAGYKYLALATPVSQFYMASYHYMASYQHEERHDDSPLKIVAVLVAGPEGPALVPTVPATVVGESAGETAMEIMTGTASCAQRSVPTEAPTSKE
jgi:hypothetical protein